MKYVAAYVLCQMGGSQSPTAKDIERVIKAGLAKISSVPSGGAAPSAAAAATPAAEAPAQETKKGTF
ncbi:unnamed protein product [Gongylonema pulchrum]|uniref:Large ribosomal subunit protein P2 n=1 Tax=Gongylonema pulchrum TaxID=637853 RepID=A0A183EES9_9BILA|nr:unnamed protein product [Gongylonema pulchrum]